MLPTFVIGLREGLEASLIVGIVAAFLRQRGRRDLLRWVFAGVSASILMCLAVGIVLRVVSQNLPQKQQEGLETVIGAIAVVMVTYMVVWMRRHSRGLKGQLTAATETAIAAGSGYALVAMAFLAVLREGFETVVFLLAAFNESDSGASAGVGALLGILMAVALGYGIYRGGVRINLSKFFRVTGVVLVLVAAGLVVTALHTAHEAGWLNVGQQRTVDLTSIVRPGSVQASLLTGMLGVQEHPVLIEVIGWLVFLIPVGLYIAWPPGRALRPVTVARAALAGAGLLAIATVVVALVAAGRPGPAPELNAGGFTGHIIDQDGPSGRIEAGAPGRATATFTVQRTASEVHDGVAADVYTGTRPSPTDVGALPTTISVADVAQANGGRLPLGAQVTGGTVPVRYDARDIATFWIAPRTGQVVDMRWRELVARSATLSTGPVVLSPLRDQTEALPRAAAVSAGHAAQRAATALDRHRTLTAVAVGTGVGAGVLFATALIYAAAARRGRRPALGATTTPAAGLASS